MSKLAQVMASLLEPMLNSHWWDCVAFTWEQFQISVQAITLDRSVSPHQQPQLVTKTQGSPTSCSLSQPPNHSVISISHWPTCQQAGWFIAVSLIARFMGATWGPSGADRTQVGPMLAPWTLLSGYNEFENHTFEITATCPSQSPVS